MLFEIASKVRHLYKVRIFTRNYDHRYTSGCKTTRPPAAGERRRHSGPWILECWNKEQPKSDKTACKYVSRWPSQSLPRNLSSGIATVGFRMAHPGGDGGRRRPSALVTMTMRSSRAEIVIKRVGPLKILPTREDHACRVVSDCRLGQWRT
jgi:hypothetical protein